jgi:hypothetical protein
MKILQVEMELLLGPGLPTLNKPFIFNNPRMAVRMQFEKGRRSGAHRGAFEWI